MKIEDLNQNGIAISELPSLDGGLPQHIERVRAFLLDFACTLVDGLEEDDDVCIEDYVLQRRDLDDVNKELREEYKTIRDDARILHRGRDREAEWQTFFLMNFFRPLVKAARVEDTDTRNTARAKFYYEYFESAQSRPWTLFRKRKEDDWSRENGFRQDDRENLTEPKPDWVAFFPIYNFPGERIPTSQRWQLMKDPKPAMVENFSPATLQHLSRHGVQSNTANIFRTSQTLENVILSDCLCFPWLIVEHKKAGETSLEEKCHCQAANAGTAAVMMLETLARIVPGVEGHTANEYIPPVVTMTTVDKVVRVWITYCCEQQPEEDDNDGDDTTKYKMACIWRGDMTLVSDLVKLRAILENTHTWAMREQRPRISAYIDLWKYKYPPTATTSTTTTTMTMTTMATTMTTTVVAAVTGCEVEDEDDERGASLAPSLAHLSLRSPDLGLVVDVDELVPAVDVDDLVPAADVDEQVPAVDVDELVLAVDVDELVLAVDVDEQVDEAVRALVDDGMSTPEMGSEGSDGGDELESEDGLDTEDDLESEEDGDSEYNPDDEDALDAEEGLDTAKEGLDAAKEGIGATKEGLEAPRWILDAARDGLDAGTKEGLDAAKDGLDAAEEVLYDAEYVLEDAEEDLAAVEEALDYLCDEEYVESQEDLENGKDLENEDDVANEEDVESEEDVENEEDVGNEEDEGSEEDLGGEEDVDIEDCGREDGLRTGDESPEPAELAEEEESMGGNSTDDGPLTWTGVLTWGEQTIEGGPTPEEQPAVEEPSVSGEPITREEAVEEESACEEPASSELSSTCREWGVTNRPAIPEEPGLEEPSTPPPMQHSTAFWPQPTPKWVLQELASRARPTGSTHQNTGPDSDSEQPRPLPETITRIGGTHTSLRYWNIFKTGIYIPHASGRRIRVRLPPAPERRGPVPSQPQAAPTPMLAPSDHTFSDSGALAWIHPTTTTTDIHIPPGRRLRVRLPDPKRQQARVPVQQQQQQQQQQAQATLPPPGGGHSMFESLARPWLYPPPASDDTHAEKTPFAFKGAFDVKPSRFQFSFAAPNIPTTPTPTPAPRTQPPPNLAQGAAAAAASTTTIPPTPPTLGPHNTTDSDGAFWKESAVSWKESAVFWKESAVFWKDKANFWRTSTAFWQSSRPPPPPPPPSPPPPPPSPPPPPLGMVGVGEGGDDSDRDGPLTAGSPSAGRGGGGGGGGGSVFSMESMRGALPPTPEPTPGRERMKSPSEL